MDKEGSVMTMTKVFKSGLNIVMIGLLLVSTFTPLTTLANELEGVDSYTEEAMKAYEETMEKVEVAKETNTEEDIKAAYESFVKITPELNAQNYGAYMPKDMMDKVFFEVIDLVYDGGEEKNKASRVLDFAKAWYEILMKNYNSLYVNHFSLTVVENSVPTIQKELEDMLAELTRYSSGIPSSDGIIPLPTDEELEDMLDDFYENYGPDEEDPDKMTDEEMEKQLKEEYKQLPSNESSETVYYEKIGGVWFEVTETITNGKLVKSDRRQMSATESYFLEVRENPSYDPYNTIQSIEYVTERDWDYFTTDQNVESRYTIHYTVNKDDSSPYYYDTGMRVSDSLSASYEQYKDVLRLLSEKSEGFFVEDKAKVLAVLEGQPIVIHDAKEFYGKKELEGLFEDFDKVDIRVMETKIGQAGSLEESIVSKNADAVSVNGTAINLEANPKVKNNRALLPLNEITVALGGTLSQDGDKYVAQSGKTQAVFRTGDSSVYINGKRITLNNAPIIEDNVVFVEVGELATAFGYTMTWDSDTEAIEFLKR